MEEKRLPVAQWQRRVQILVLIQYLRMLLYLPQERTRPNNLVEDAAIARKRFLDEINARKAMPPPGSLRTLTWGAVEIEQSIIP